MEFRALDPMYRLNFSGKTMLARSRPEEMGSEIDRVFPGEGEGFRRFLSAERVRFRKLYPCLQKGYGSPTHFLDRSLMAALPHTPRAVAIRRTVSQYFRSEELRLAFTFQSKYLGMSPWDCPGLFAMIPYTEHAHGVYHVIGGLCRMPQSFAQVAREEGAEIHTSCAVKRVLLENGKARGVELENGEKVFSDDVVINADFGHAMSTLFPDSDLAKYKPAALKKRKFSCSTFMLYLGVDRTYPEAEHHTIVFAQDYKKCLEEITKSQIVSNDLSVYVRNAAPLDPSCAPAGHSALYILAPVPNNMSGIDWREHKAAYRERILDLLEERTPYKDLRSHIRAERMITPADWETGNVRLSRGDVQHGP